MFERKNFFRAGLIKKPFGVNGELIFLFDKEISVELKEKEPVFPEIDGKLVPFFIEYFQWQNDTELRLKPEDIHNKEEAARLTGKDFFLKREYLADAPEEINALRLEGYTVEDQDKGNIGTIREIISQNAQDLLLIRSHENEFMIPVTGEYILSVNHNQPKVITTLPEELIKLNE